MSQSSAVDYVYAISKTATSSDNILAALLNADLPNNSATSAFANELFLRIPRSKTQSSASLLKRKQEGQHTKNEIRLNDSYAIITETKKPKKKKKKFDLVEEVEEGVLDDQIQPLHPSIKQQKKIRNKNDDFK